jgi:hypothetical protein
LPSPQSPDRSPYLKTTSLRSSPAETLGGHQSGFHPPAQRPMPEIAGTSSVAIYLQIGASFDIAPSPARYFRSFVRLR